MGEKVMIGGGKCWVPFDKPVKSLSFLRMVGSGNGAKNETDSGIFIPHDTTVKKWWGFFGLSFIDRDIPRDRNTWTIGILYDYQLPTSHLPEYHLVSEVTKSEHRNRN